MKTMLIKHYMPLWLRANDFLLAKLQHGKTSFFFSTNWDEASMNGYSICFFSIGKCGDAIEYIIFYTSKVKKESKHTCISHTASLLPLDIAS